MSKKANPIPLQLRQGDVLLVAVDEIPSNATECPRDKVRGVVLAEGEATGHFHGIASRHASLHRTEGDVRFMRATAGVELGHQEHKTRCHECPELPLTLATHYNAAASWPHDQEHEPGRYSCDEHAGAGDTKLEEPGKTVIPPGKYERVIDADYVPGELPRDVAD